MVGIPPVSEVQISTVQQQLLERIRNGNTQEIIIETASRSLEPMFKMLAYAIAVEITLSNSKLTGSELEYIKLLRDILELDNDGVKSINFSAKLRYGFGELE